MKEKEALEKTKEEIKQREAREAELKGRPGKGYKRTGWKTFCNHCWREFFVDGVDKCTHCGRDTVTFDVSTLRIHCFFGFGFSLSSLLVRELHQLHRNFQNLITNDLGTHGLLEGQG